MLKDFIENDKKHLYPKNVLADLEKYAEKYPNRVIIKKHIMTEAEAKDFLLNLDNLKEKQIEKIYKMLNY